MKLCYSKKKQKERKTQEGKNTKKIEFDKGVGKDLKNGTQNSPVADFPRGTHQNQFIDYISKIHKTT